MHPTFSYVQEACPRTISTQGKLCMVTELTASPQVALCHGIGSPVPIGPWGGPDDMVVYVATMRVQSEGNGS